MKRPGSKKHGTRKTLGLVLVLGLLAAATYGYTALNTVDPSYAGDGTGEISGYAVTDISYTAAALDATQIETVTFQLDAPASTVKARLLSDDATVDALQTFASCTGGTAITDPVTSAVLGYTWTCDVTNMAFAKANDLRVVAYQ